MSAEALTHRALSALAKIDSKKARRSGELTEFEMKSYFEAFSKLPERLLIDPSPILTPADIRARLNVIRIDLDVKFIVIDYLQRMKVSERTDNETHRVSLVSNSLAAIAKEFNLVVIGLAQLNRDSSFGQGKDTKPRKPRLSDLRQSGVIEQDADLVLFPWRPEYFKHEHSFDSMITKESAEIVIAKHREGETRDINVTFIKQYTQFGD
jgi:replicative DNA helicase